MKVLIELLRVCGLAKRGYVESPHKLEPYTIARIYADKVVHGPSFCGTLPNIVKYIFLVQGSREGLWLR